MSPKFWVRRAHFLKFTSLSENRALKQNMPFLNFFCWYLFMLRLFLYLCVKCMFIYVYLCCFCIYSYFVRYSLHTTTTVILPTTINIKYFKNLLLLQTSLSFILFLDNPSRHSEFNSKMNVPEYLHDYPF